MFNLHYDGTDKMVVKKAKANPMRNIRAQIRSTTIAAYFHSPSFRSLFSKMLK